MSARFRFVVSEPLDAALRELSEAWEDQPLPMRIDNKIYGDYPISAIVKLALTAFAEASKRNPITDGQFKQLAKKYHETSSDSLEGKHITLAGEEAVAFDTLEDCYGAVEIDASGLYVYWRERFNKRLITSVAVGWLYEVEHPRRRKAYAKKYA